MKNLECLEDEIVKCRRCRRLVAWREEVALVKRRAFLDWDYWGKPVPGFGDPHAHTMVVGLAPGAHGSNRTGRMFTGDASGDFLYPALFKAGFANIPKGEKRDDGLKLTDMFITAVCRCVPPGNKPNPDELISCQNFLEQEIRLIDPKIIITLGRIAFERILSIYSIRISDMTFCHGASYSLNEKLALICSYHPSRQNTQTGRLTSDMFDQIWMMVRKKLQ